MSLRRPALAFLTCHLPYPPHSGGRRRDYELITRLVRTYDVHLCVATKTYEHDVANRHALEEVCASVAIFRKHGPPDPDHPDLATLPAQVIDNRCPELTDHVAGLALRGVVDLIHVEGYYLMQHVPTESRVPVFLVEQNVEYMLWRQRVETTLDPKLRSHLFGQYLKTLESEIATWRRSDLVGALTREDQEGILAAAPGLDVRIVPDGADHLDHDLPRDPVPRPEGDLVVFVANFAYQPNADAAMFLCSEIFPRIKTLRPDVTVWLVGNAPPVALTDVASIHPGITVMANVPSVVPYLDAADVVVCPLRIGGGIKVKILEALTRGKAVVTTSVGAQGFSVSFRNVAVIADDPATFARATARLLDDPVSRRYLERRARDFARNLPRWDEAADALVTCYGELLGRLRREPSHLD